MPGLPTVQVLLDDGTGTFPYDITAKTRMTEGITITAGRQDEQGQISASTCALTLDNTDGRFTTGSTIIASPSPIKVNQRIRVKLTVSGTTVNRFTGYVQEWPVAWPSGGEEFSTVSITVSDALARLGRIPTRTPLTERLLLSGATLVYPMTEPTPNVAAGMVGPALWPVGSAAAAVGPIKILGATDAYPDSYPVFAAEAMPNDNGSAVTIPAGTTSPYPYRFGPLAGGSTDTFTGPGTLMTADWSMSFLWRSTGKISAFSGLVQLGDAQSPSNNAVYGYPTSQGGIKFSNYVAGSETQIESSTVVQDGDWHYITVVQTNSGKTTALFVDDENCGTVVNASSPAGIALDAIKLGGYISGDDPTVSLGHFAFWPSAVSFATHQLIKEVAIGSAGARSDDLISRYAQIAGVAFSAAEAGSQNVPTFNSADIAALMLEAMAAERGRLYVDGSGTLTFESRLHPLADVYAGTPDITGTVDLLNDDATISVDPQRLVNRAEVARSGGPAQTSEDAASIAQHGVYGTSETVRVMDDSQAGNLAAYLVWLNAQPAARLAGAKIDLLTQTTALQQAFLVNLMGAWLRLTGMPLQSPTGATADVYIEGWIERISATEWSLAPNTSPKRETATTWWRLNDANFPLGTNTHPFY